MMKLLPCIVFSIFCVVAIAPSKLRWLDWMATSLRIAGGTGILLFGIILALGSLGGPSGSGLAII